MITLIIWAIVGVVVLVGLIGLAIYMINNCHYFWENFSMVLRGFFTLLLFVWLVTFGLVIPEYYSSTIKVNYLNKKYDLNLTAKEYFWMGSIIDKELKKDIDLLDSNQRIKIKIEE